MGRSVLTHPRAVVVAYTSWDTSYEEYIEGWDDDPDMMPSEQVYYDFYAPEDWRDTQEWFVEQCQDMWPSLWETSRYPHDEVHTVLENNLIEISVSEYCGLTALCIAPRNDIEDSLSGLAIHVAEQMEAKFDKAFNTYYRVATFNDGTSMYEEAKK